jgi:hypothetical protein
MGPRITLFGFPDFRRLREKPETPLEAAMRANDPALLRAALEGGADPNLALEGGHLPLGLACQRGRRELAEILLDHGADPGLHDIFGAPLMRLCGSESGEEVAMARLLAARGAPLGASNRRGETPLHSAARMRQGDLMLALLELGADPALPDHEGLPPGQSTPNSRNSVLVAHVLSGAATAPPPGALAEAAETGSLDCVRRFIQAGADIDENDGAALAAAAHWRRAGSVALLLELGADPLLGEGLDKALLSCERGVLEPFVAAGASREYLDARLRALPDDRKIMMHGRTGQDWFHGFAPEAKAARPPLADQRERRRRRAEAVRDTRDRWLGR